MWYENKRDVFIFESEDGQNTFHELDELPMAGAEAARVQQVSATACSIS